MSFLKDVAAPKQTRVGGFLDSVQLPTEQQSYISSLQRREYNLQQTAQRENSFSGILKGTFGSLKERAGTTAKGVLDSLLTPPAPKSLDMQSALQQGWDTISTTIQDSARRFQELPSAFSKGKTGAERAAIVGSAAMGAINDAFIGVTAPLNALRGVPGVGYLADGIHNLFSALGTGGGSVASNALDGLPISQKSKESIRPLVTEVGALVGQLVGGKAGTNVAARISTKSKQILDALDSEINAARLANNIGPVRGIRATGESAETAVQFANKYEPPGTIQIGAKSKEALPVIQAGATEYRPTVKGGFIDSVEVPQKVSSPTGTTRPSVPLGTPEKATSKLAVDIERKLGTELADLPEYSTMNMRDQAQKALDLITENEPRAKKIALGQEKAPQGLREGSVFVAMRERAFQAGDTETLIELSKSKLASEASILGQRIKAFDSGTSDNPVRILQDVQRERVAAVERKSGVKIEEAKAKVVKDIKTEMKKDIPTKRAWEEFIRSIECGY